MTVVRRGLDLVAAAAVLVHAPAAAAVLLAHSAWRRSFGPLAGWWWAFAPLGLLWVWLLATGRFELWLLLQAGTGLFFAAVAKIHFRHLAELGIATALAVFVGLGLLERELSRGLWADGATPQAWSDIVAGTARVSGDSPGWRRNGVRLIEKVWDVREPARTLELTFEAKHLSGDPGWQWYTNHPLTDQELMRGEGTAFTRITNPAEGRRYVVQRVRTNGAVAGRTFRASLELRAETPVTAEGCDGLQLRTLDPIEQACQGIELDTTWRDFVITTEFSDIARQPAFELIINRVDAPTVDVRNVRIEERVGGEWQVVGHVEPAGAQVRFPLEGVHIFSHPTINFVPDETWRRHTLGVQLDEPYAPAQARFLLQVESGLELAIRDVTLRANGSDAPVMAHPLGRFELWFPHANLAGHAIVASGLLLLLLVRGPWPAVLAAGLVLVAVFLTGSRAAWGAALLGLPWMIWLSTTGRSRLAALAVIGLVAAAALFGPLAEGLGRLQLLAPNDDNPVARTEIWKVAYRAMIENPLSGLGGHESAFGDYWHGAYQGTATQRVTHAHNLWLAFGSSFGLPGLLAAIWLTVALLVLAWRWGRFRGVAVLMPLFAMNLVDYTLFFPAVLLPAILAMNFLRSQAGGAPPAPGQGRQPRYPPIARTDT